MNYKAMEWAFTRPLADSSAKFLLVAIAGHAGRDLSCFPSYSRLSGMTGMSVRTITRKVTVLQEAGLVSVAVRKRPNGSYTSSQYTLIMKDPEDNLSGGYSQNGVTIRDNNKNNNNNSSSSISYGGDKMADGEVDWTDFANEILGNRNGRDDSKMGD
jgi:pyocin large subunit-like protein